MKRIGSWLTLRTAVLAVSSAVLLMSFYWLAREIRAGETFSFDDAVLEWFYAHATPFWDNFFLMVTAMGGPLTITCVAVGLAVYFLVRKQWRRLWLVVAGVGGAVMVNTIIKLIVERPRPDLWEQLVVETSFSFPSGHAMASSALAIFLGYLVVHAHFGRWVKTLLVGLLVLYALLVGVSRMYLGVHYPTDVIGGWMMTVAWMSIIVPLVEYWTRQRGDD